MPSFASASFICLLVVYMIMITNVNADIAILDCFNLQQMNRSLNENYFLVNNIDCNVAPLNTLFGFIPIPPFSGSLDCRKFTINNLFSYRYYSVWNNVGLFESLTNLAEVRNCNFYNLSVTGVNNVGGIAGSNYGKITNVHILGASPNNPAQVLGTSIVGGIAGYNDGTIYNCTSNIKVNALFDSCGGIVGLNQGIIERCRMYGEKIWSKGGFVGGIAGRNSAGTISWSSSSGDVTSANGNFIGGLVGRNDANGIIHDSYSTSNVYGNDFIGGFLGGVSSGKVYNTYSIGKVTSTNDPIQYNGGYCGQEVIVGSIYDSFFDNITSNMVITWGGVGKTTSALFNIDTYSSFTFASDKWVKVNSNSYPVFKTLINDTVYPLCAGIPKIYPANTFKPGSCKANSPAFTKCSTSCNSSKLVNNKYYVVGKLDAYCGGKGLWSGFGGTCELCNKAVRLTIPDKSLLSVSNVIRASIDPRFKIIPMELKFTITSNLIFASLSAPAKNLKLIFRHTYIPGIWRTSLALPNGTIAFSAYNGAPVNKNNTFSISMIGNSYVKGTYTLKLETNYQYSPTTTPPANGKVVYFALESTTSNCVSTSEIVSSFSIPTTTKRRDDNSNVDDSRNTDSMLYYDQPMIIDDYLDAKARASMEQVPGLDDDEYTVSSIFESGTSYNE
jgi:hypothetical protein